MIVGQGPIALAVGAGGGCLDIFTLIFLFSFLSPSLRETARYRLKYCLKGPLNPKQPTNQPTNLISLLYWRYLPETQSSCSLSKGEVILQFFFLTKLCPFFDLEFSKCSYSRVLAPACSALVRIFTVPVPYKFAEICRLVCIISVFSCLNVKANFPLNASGMSLINEGNHSWLQIGKNFKDLNFWTIPNFSTKTLALLRIPLHRAVQMRLFDSICEGIHSKIGVEIHPKIFEILSSKVCVWLMGH